MATIATSKDKWDLFAGVLVERLPVLSKTLEPIQKEFQVLILYALY
jgi:large subunit ribosomal protein L46